MILVLRNDAKGEVLLGVAETEPETLQLIVINIATRLIRESKKIPEINCETTREFVKLAVDEYMAHLSEFKLVTI